MAVTYAAAEPCDVTPCESLVTFSTLYGTDAVSECVCASKEEARHFEKPYFLTVVDGRGDKMHKNNILHIGSLHFISTVYMFFF